MTLDNQIAFAQSLFANGEQVQALLKQREKLTADLTKVNEELATLLPAAPATNGSSRAAQTCKWENPDGSICGSTDHNKRFHTKPGGN